MTKKELRLELLKLVWPMQQGRENADPFYYITKAKALEEWCNEEAAGQPARPAQSARTRSTRN